MEVWEFIGKLYRFLAGNIDHFHSLPSAISGNENGREHDKHLLGNQRFGITRLSFVKMNVRF